jgi:hypothetical protein
VIVHFLSLATWRASLGVLDRDFWLPEALCGARTTLFAVTELETEVTCPECRADLLGPDVGDLGSLLQSGPVPPQRSEIEPPM